MRNPRSFWQSLLTVSVLAAVAALTMFGWLLLLGTENDGAEVVSVQNTADWLTDRENSTESTVADPSSSNIPFHEGLQTAVHTASTETIIESLDPDSRGGGASTNSVADDATAIIVTGGEDRDSHSDIEFGSGRVADQLSQATVEGAQFSETESDVSGQSEDEPEPIENSGVDVLAGRVVNQRGLPIANLAITASRRDENHGFSGTQRTDAEGQFEFRNIADGEYRLTTAETSRYPSVSEYARSGTTSTTLIVDHRYGIEVMGRVTDIDGQPVEAVDVSTPDAEVRATSDATGSYRINIESTDAQGFALRFAAPGYLDDLVPIVARADNGPVALNHKMRRSGSLSISGQVLDSQLLPIEGALVQITSRQRKFHDSILSGKDGRFQLAGVLPASDYQVKASSSADYGTWLREDVDIAESQAFSISLPAAGRGRVVGSIVDLNQTPLSDFSMLAVRGGSGGPIVEFKSDASGYFEIDNVVAEELSFVSKSTPRIRITGARVGIGDEERVTLVVNIGTYQLSGRLLDFDTELPIAGARLTMDWLAPSGNLLSRINHTTTSDLQGNFLFTRLGGGKWTLSIDAVGYDSISEIVNPAVDLPIWLWIQQIPPSD